MLTTSRLYRTDITDIRCLRRTDSDELPTNNCATTRISFVWRPKVSSHMSTCMQCTCDVA